MFAFEVSNFFRTRGGVVNVIAAIPGVCVVRSPKFLSSFREDEFCEFEFEGVRFVAWEPFGDSNCYWIGPELSRWVPQIEQLRAAFEKA